VTPNEAAVKRKGSTMFLKVGIVNIVLGESSAPEIRQRSSQSRDNDTQGYVFTAVN